MMKRDICLKRFLQNTAEFYADKLPYLMKMMKRTERRIKELLFQNLWETNAVKRPSYGSGCDHAGDFCIAIRRKYPNGGGAAEFVAARKRKGVPEGCLYAAELGGT